MPHSSAILPSTMRWMRMTLLVISLPLGARPIISPRSWVECTMKRVTTLSFAATWSSTSTLAFEMAPATWAAAHITPSRPGSSSGSSLVWLTKSGGNIASKASTSPLTRASMKRLANAMFSSADIEVLLLADLRFPPTGRRRPMMPPEGVWRIDRSLIHRSAWRDCLKSPDSPETKVVEAYETDQKGPFCCGMPTILAHETPLSDFLDSFYEHLGTVAKKPVGRVEDLSFAQLRGSEARCAFSSAFATVRVWIDGER